MIFFFFFVREFGLFQQVCPRLLTMFPSKFLQPHCVSFLSVFVRTKGCLRTIIISPRNDPGTCVCVCVCVCVCPRSKRGGQSIADCPFIFFSLSLLDWIVLPADTALAAAHKLLVCQLQQATTSVALRFALYSSLHPFFLQRPS